MVEVDVLEHGLRSTDNFIKLIIYLEHVHSLMI